MRVAIRSFYCQEEVVKIILLVTRWDGGLARQCGLPWPADVRTAYLIRFQKRQVLGCCIPGAVIGVCHP